MSENISVLRPGITLEGDGGVSTGAIVLANKQADEFTDIILCFAPKSIHDPFVVWTYENASCVCRRGDYFRTLKEAMNIYEKREW
jgi:hypothetical protein